MTSHFRPHGEFTCHVDGRLIVSDVAGPWNLELVQAWAAELHQHASRMTPGPHEGTRHFDSRATLVVADATVEGRDFMAPSFAKMYRDITPHRFFSDYPSARAWALDLLARELA